MTVRSDRLAVVAARPCCSKRSCRSGRKARLEDHFRGKTLSVIIPTTPGGDRMANAAPFIKYFGRHIPGQPNVVPSFMPGAGGAVGMNYLQSIAPRDGLTIATPLAPVVVAQVTREKTVKYDVAKMNWIGAHPPISTQVLYVWHTVDAHTLDDLRRVARLRSARLVPPAPARSSRM